MQGTDKGVVYCRSRASSEQVARRLGCDYYHSQLDVETRRRRLRRWATAADGASRWIVATSGLGTGIDIGGIVAVVHVEPPWGMVDFIQQTGRGARRPGETVASIVVTGPGVAWRDAQQSDVAAINMAAMDEFMTSDGCRRAVVSRFMDGVVAMCRDTAGAVWCDHCERDGAVAVTPSDNGEDRVDRRSLDARPEESDETSEEESVDDRAGGPRRLGSDRREEAAGRRRWQRWLTESAGHCSVCWTDWCARGRPRHESSSTRHREDECDKLPVEQFRAWRRLVTFPVFRGCFTCGLGQAWCPGWQGGVDCLYGSRVMRVVMWVSTQIAWTMIVEDAVEYCDFELSAYALWAGRRRWVYGEAVTNGVAVWDVMVQACYTD